MKGVSGVEKKKQMADSGFVDGKIINLLLPMTSLCVILLFERQNIISVYFLFENVNCIVKIY
jgi:hypothetical protein